MCVCVHYFLIFFICHVRIGLTSNMSGHLQYAVYKYMWCCVCAMLCINARQGSPQANEARLPTSIWSLKHLALRMRSLKEFKSHLRLTKTRPRRSCKHKSVQSTIHVDIRISWESLSPKSPGSVTSCTEKQTDSCNAISCKYCSCLFNKSWVFTRFLGKLRHQGPSNSIAKQQSPIVRLQGQIGPDEPNLRGQSDSWKLTDQRINGPCHLSPPTSRMWPMGSVSLLL